MEKVEDPNSSSTTSQVQNSEDYGINNVEVIRNWKLPDIDVKTIYSPKEYEVSMDSDDHIYRKEITIPINTSEVEIDLLDSSDLMKKAGINCYTNKKGYFHFGLVQVAVKFLRRRRTNASACCLVRDARFLDFEESILGLVSGSLSQGILYFICKLDHCLSLQNDNILKSLQLKMATQGIEMVGGPVPVSLTYAVYYRNCSSTNANVKGDHTGDIGFTEVIKTDIHDDTYVPPTLSWNEIKVPNTWKKNAKTKGLFSLCGRMMGKSSSRK